MLKGKFVGQYRSSKTGNLVFKYDVIGKEVSDYEASKGSNVRHNDDTGNPLFFTTRYSGDNISFIKTNPEVGEGEWIVDTSEMDKLTSLAQSNPMLKEEIAKHMLAQILKASTPSTQSAPAVEAKAQEVEPEESEDDELL